MKKLLSVLLCVALTLSLVACSTSTSTPAPSQSTEKDAPLRVANLINGTLGDLSFFDSAENGMRLLKAELGDAFEYRTIEMSYVETSWEPHLIDASEGDYDIIICGTWQMQEILERFADQYPEKTYILYDASVQWSLGDYSNVHCIEYMQNEGSYLAGVLAANLTNSGRVAFLGGMDNPVINDFLVGYVQGVIDTDPTLKVDVAYVGNFNDATRGADISAVQFAGGADVGFACAGQAGLGMFDAALSAGGVTMIGVDSDQAMIFKGQGKVDLAQMTATSMLKRVDMSLVNAIHAYLDGTLEIGKSAQVGLDEQCVGLAVNEYYTSTVPADVRAQVDDAAALIQSGEIQVATSFGMSQADLEAFLSQAR